MRPYLLLASVLAFGAQADNPYIQNQDKLGGDDGLAFSLFAGYTHGGDNFVAVNYTNGTKENFRFGNRYHLGLGGLWENGTWGAAFNLGYHFNFADGTNGEIELERYTAEFLPYYRWDRHKFLLGPSWHFDVKADIDIDGVHEKFDFDDALGWIVEYNYQITQHNWVGVRYQWVEYDLEKYNGIAVPSGLSGDGDHWGVYYRVVF
ncbi:hypothetical protein [Gallaecimonas xiamenensis]|uniref:Outer membrane protein beta-barrel domain-containing protein n=1 Tax=Gallaecimonas xiamenensis 3-C-1 TaxID=745411 RepID=K2JYQ7_9GAMM|nr:hypothetical protein [Gallaecimonas xiamenensis]EKE75469.1 hypothetical protein B3C1_07324 [Gallaecimonas xiamenensis 3-C-1]